MFAFFKLIFVVGGGGGGCIPEELHLLLMQPPVSNVYDNISYDGLGKLVCGGEGVCLEIP